MSARLHYPRPPWEDHPYDLTDWLEVLNFSAYRFFWCGVALRAINADCVLGSIPFGDAPLIQLSRTLDGRAVEKALSSLRQVEGEFRQLGMMITAETVKDIIRALEAVPPDHNFQWLIDQTSNIESLARKEFRGKAFFYVPPERAIFFPRTDNVHMFGEAVATAFPSAVYDVAESGTCLALARSTACVFHLMRVLEIGLTALGAKFGISLEHTNWAPAIDQIEKKIRTLHVDPAWKALPDCKEQQEFYAQVASHFGVLKDAWRNYTMMPGDYILKSKQSGYTRTSRVSYKDFQKDFTSKNAEFSAARLRLAPLPIASPPVLLRLFVNLGLGHGDDASGKLGEPLKWGQR